jgi:hypothetical protein
MSYKKSTALVGLGSSIAIAIAGVAELFGIQDALFYAVPIFIIVLFISNPLVVWLRKKAERPGLPDSSRSS